MHTSERTSSHSVRRAARGPLVVVAYAASSKAPIAAVKRLGSAAIARANNLFPLLYKTTGGASRRRLLGTAGSSTRERTPGLSGTAGPGTVHEGPGNSLGTTSSNDEWATLTRSPASLTAPPPTDAGGVPLPPTPHPPDWRGGRGPNATGFIGNSRPRPRPRWLYLAAAGVRDPRELPLPRHILGGVPTGTASQGRGIP